MEEKNTIVETFIPPNDALICWLLECSYCGDVWYCNADREIEKCETCHFFGFVKVMFFCRTYPLVLIYETPSFYKNPKVACMIESTKNSMFPGCKFNHKRIMTY